MFGVEKVNMRVHLSVLYFLPFVNTIEVSVFVKYVAAAWCFVYFDSSCSILFLSSANGLHIIGISR